MDAKQVEGDARETLEVESSEDRQARLGTSPSIPFRSTTSTTSTTSTIKLILILLVWSGQLFSSITGEASRQDPGIPVIGERKTFQVGESDGMSTITQTSATLIIQSPTESTLNSQTEY